VGRLLYNSDGTNMFIRPSPMAATDLLQYVDEVAGSQVTTFLASPNAGQNFYCPSRAGDYIGKDWSDGDLDAMARQEGRALLATVTRNVRDLIRAGHDPLAIVLARCRERGLEAFITFRMNELHDVDRQDSPLISRFYREHPEWRLNEPGHGWLGLAPNFAVREVRERRIAEIEDLVDRYDIDGLELDFQRFPAYFPHADGVAKTHAPLMTELVAEIRRHVERVASRRGRSILLSARVPGTLQGCLKIGLDPAEWHRRDLLDFLTIAPFLRTLFRMPVQEFKAALSGLPVYAGVEFSAQHHEGKARPMTPELYRGVAASLMAQEADGVSLFNMFCARENAEHSWEPPFSVLREIGSHSTLAGIPKLYLVDRRSDFDQPADPVPVLPAAVAPAHAATVSLFVGEGDCHARECLLRIETEPALPCGALFVSLNARLLPAGRAVDRSRVFPEPHDETPQEAGRWQEFVLLSGALRAGKNQVQVTSGVPCTVLGIELAVPGS